MNARTKANPFAQPKYFWKASFDLPEQAVPTAENAFDGVAMAVSVFEVDEAAQQWRCELLSDVPMDMEDIKRRLLVLGSVCAFATPEVQLEQLAQQDWLAQVSQNFPPLSIGRFYVHGAHVEPPVHSSMIPIKVDAGAAFGSG